MTDLEKLRFVYRVLDNYAHAPVSDRADAYAMVRELIESTWKGENQAPAASAFDKNSPEFQALTQTIRAAAAANAVPAGFWLAPMEPDEDMWTEGRDPIMYRDLGDYRPASSEVPAWQREPNGEVNHDKSKGTAAVRVWRAMRDSWLSRHPQPQSVTEGRIAE